MHRKPFLKCPHCPKLFTAKDRIKKHIELHFLDTSKDHVCHVCGRMYYTSATLKVHSKVHLPNYSKPPEIPCEICGTLARKGGHYKRHLKTHETRVCTVEGCNLKFVGVAKFEYHLKNGHATPTPCPTCHIVFPSEFKMNYHYKHQHGLKVPCKILGCSHVASSKRNLLFHVKEHKDISESEKKVLQDELKPRNRWSKSKNQDDTKSDENEKAEKEDFWK